jgi:hypothetical protein
VTIMDFIERILHLSPDHGDGTLEAVLLFAILAVPIAWAILRTASALRTRLVADGLQAADAEDRQRITP